MKRAIKRPTAAQQRRQEVTKAKSPKFSWNKVRKGGQDECWPWTGGLNKWGYGACLHQGRQRNASRAAYIETYGEIDQKLVVCHRCDNPACCNPAHLFLGTVADNLRDCREKGRQRYLTGKAHHRSAAKLTEEQVLQARARYAAGEKQTVIAAEFGVHSSNLSRAIRGRIWRHVK